MSRVDFDGTGAVETDDEADWRERREAARVSFFYSADDDEWTFENDSEVSAPKPIARHMLRMWFGDNDHLLIGKPLTTIKFTDRAGAMLLIFENNLELLCLVDRRADPLLHEDGLREEIEESPLKLVDVGDTAGGVTRLTFLVPRIVASDFSIGMITMGTGIMRTAYKSAYRSTVASTFLRR